MSKIKFAIYGDEAEITEFTADGGNTLIMEFARELTGFVKLAEMAARLDGGRCEFDLRLIDSGEYTPELFLKSARIPLHRIRKCGKIVEPMPYTSDFVRGLSLRERALEERVALLDERIALLEKRVYETTIF